MYRRPKIEVNLTAKLAGHPGGIYTLQNPEEGRLISCGSGGLVAEWDILQPDSGKALAKVTQPIYASCLEAETQRLFFAETGEGLHAVEFGSKQYSGNVKLEGKQFFDLKIWKQYLLVAAADGVLTLLTYLPFKTYRRIKISEKSLRRIALIEPLNLIAIATSDFKIYLLDGSDFTLVDVLEGHKNSVFALGFHKETGLLVSGSRDAHLNFWDSSLSFKKVESVPAHLYAINDLDFSADGKWMASASMDKAVKIWDMQQLQLVKVLDKARHAGHGTSVNAVKWLDNSHKLAAGGDDRVISVWSLTFTEN